MKYTQHIEKEVHYGFNVHTQYILKNNHKKSSIYERVQIGSIKNLRTFAERPLTCGIKQK